MLLFGRRSLDSWSLIERLAAAGVNSAADRAVVRSMMSGLAAEQIANEPNGRTFADQTPRAVRFILAGLGGGTTPRQRRK